MGTAISTHPSKAELTPEPARSDRPWEPPEEFDGYRLLSWLGRGAMGQVYLAQDVLLERAAAVKVIDGISTGAAARERFFLEARAIARLQHPNVVSVYRVGEVDGHPYLVSEYVRGQRLDQLPLPLPAERVLRLGLGLARGLAAAHRRGVLHRDVKPANAIVSDGGEVKLLDFGLAKLLEPTPAPTHSALDTLPPEPAISEQHRDSVAMEETLSPLPIEGSRASAQLTMAGMWMGTPAYMAPEIWDGDSASFRSDVYSTGAVLFHLMIGHPPYEAPNLDLLRRSVSEGPFVSCEPLRQQHPRLAGVIERCLQRDPSRRFSSADELRDALEALTPEARERWIPEGNPYRGLQAFEAEHRALFFGRDTEIRAVLERLAHEGFVLVAGISGVGKSSLCRAGVLPRVADVGLGDGRSWQQISFRPGKRPVSALAQGLAPLLGIDEETVANRLNHDVEQVCRDLRKSGKPLLLFADQMEELVTLSDPAESAVIARLMGLIASGISDLKLLASVRGDFLARLASLPDLADDLSRALYLLAPMRTDAIRDAIVGPARAKGVGFETDAMVQQLVDSVAHAEGALPLLQFALAELWHGRDPVANVVPASALEGMGGVRGALARHADGVLDRLLPAQRLAARRLLPRLVTLEATRARRTEEELSATTPDDKAALGALVRGRLLLVSELQGESAYEVAHEALIGSWPTLQRWLEEDAERRALRARLEAAVGEWERSGRRKDVLWGKRQLIEAEALQDERLRPVEQAFLESSVRQQHRLRRNRVLLAALAFLVASGGYGALRLKTLRDVSAKVQARVATAQALKLKADNVHRELETSRQEAFALFDAKSLDGAERVWERAEELRHNTEALLVRAGQDAEGALSLDPRDLPARTLLADVLSARAQLAEAARNFAQRDELLARLKLYDDGSRIAAWNAPATLTLRGADGLSLVLERYLPSGQLEPVPMPGGNEWVMPAGSYRLTVSSPRHQYAFELHRGEQRTLTLDPPRGALPAQMVHIPAGRAWFGSTAEEQLRRDFYHAVPLHPVQVDAFQIAQHETTFEEWIGFLESLPESERARRTPHVGTGGFRGALQLTRDTGEWRLSLQVGNHKAQARAGEPLRLPARHTHQELHWLKLPVVGLALDDVQAYLRWLDASGRVPGARLCSEQEWEHAARGGDAREFPHGDTLAANEANFDLTYGQKNEAMAPDEVGSHPASQSPFGVQDMSGNVWEWTKSALEEGEVVARGGSFAFGKTAARVSNREKLDPTFRDISLGVRVCANARR